MNFQKPEKNLFFLGYAFPSLRSLYRMVLFTAQPTPILILLNPSTLPIHTAPIGTHIYAGGPSGNQTFPQGCAPRESLISLGTSLGQIFPDNCGFSTVCPNQMKSEQYFAILCLFMAATFQD